MAYFNYYIFKKIIREIVNTLFRFIKKHKKIILFLLIYFFIFFLKNNVFAADYTISEKQIKKAESLLDSTYTRYTCHMYSNRKVIYVIGNKETGIWANNTLIQAVQSKSVAWKCYWYDESTNTATLFWEGTNQGHASQDMTHMVANFNVYANSNMTGGYYYTYIPPVTYVQPSFISTTSDLENVNNQYIKINQGSFGDSIYLRLYNHTSNALIFNTKLTNYDDYIEREDLDNPFSDLIYNIPYTSFPSFQLTYNNEYEFRLVYYNEDNILSNVSIFFTPTSTQDINDVTNKDLNDSIKDTNEKLDNIDDTLNDTNDKLDSIDDTLTDSNVDVDVENDLPSVDVQDPTQNGIDNIFNSIYNAFCTGEAQNIILPIPYTQKNISISPYYVRDMLNNNGVGWLYIFIQAFWAYLFGRFIIKDISNKINKIKSGDIDNIQNTNIKEEML